MLKPSTLQIKLKQMSPEYRAFWEALAKYRDTLAPDEFDHDDLSQVLDDLARRKDFSRADWEVHTKIQSKMYRDKSNPAAEKVSKLLDPAVARLAKR